MLPFLLLLNRTKDPSRDQLGWNSQPGRLVNGFGVSTTPARGSSRARASFG